MFRNCMRCYENKSVYNVVAPICLDSVNVQLCPSCFQDGIDHGEIVWLGDRAFGICEDCANEEHVA